MHAWRREYVERLSSALKRRGARVSQRVRLAYLSGFERMLPPRHAGYPVPPPKLRQRTTLFRLGVDEHIKDGRNVARVVEQALQSEGVDPNTVSAVLDFGCGCGRVLRHLRQLWPRARLFGVDVDAELIDWTRSYLADIAEWGNNGYQPPTSFADSSFDVVYAFSVFTHLDEQAQSAWLDEFRRILKPQGLLLITIVEMSEEQMAELSWDHYNPEGMAYRYRTNELARRSWVRRQTELPAYIDVCHRLDYCEQKWAPRFEFRRCMRDVNNGQTLVVLRKPGPMQV